MEHGEACKLTDAIFAFFIVIGPPKVTGLAIMAQAHMASILLCTAEDSEAMVAMEATEISEDMVDMGITTVIL